MYDLPFLQGPAIDTTQTGPEEESIALLLVTSVDYLYENYRITI